MYVEETYPNMALSEYIPDLTKVYEYVLLLLSQLNISKDHFLQNIFNLLKFDAYQNLQKLRQPVNKDQWTTDPAIVNAFYNPNKNEIGNGINNKSKKSLQHKKAQSAKCEYNIIIGPMPRVTTDQTLLLLDT